MHITGSYGEVGTLFVPKTVGMHTFSYRSYRLVWATKLLLAAIGLVFPALVLGYKSFNCSMYHVPVPTLIECRKPLINVPYKCTFGAPDLGQTLDM